MCRHCEYCSVEVRLPYFGEELFHGPAEIFYSLLHCAERFSAGGIFVTAALEVSSCEDIYVDIAP